MNTAKATIIFLFVWIVFCFFIASGKDIKPDLSSDFEMREGQYYEGEKGHPLWP